MKLKILILILALSQGEVSNKVLLVNGIHELDGMELLDLENNKSCFANLPKPPLAVVSNFGGIVANDILLLCGGSYAGKAHDECHALDLQSDENFIKSLSLQVPRCCGDSVNLNENEILVAGGLDNVGNLLYTTEIVGLNGVRNGPGLPYPVISPCIVKIGSKIILTGGYDLDHVFDMVSIYDGNGHWYNGPKMTVPRYDHGCASMVLESKEFLVLAGGTGYFANNLDSVDILDIENENWISGPKLPQIRYGLRLLPMQNGVLAIGGVGTDFPKDVLELNCPNGIWFCEWNAKQQLIDFHAYFLAFQIPNALLSCDEKK